MQNKDKVFLTMDKGEGTQNEFYFFELFIVFNFAF